MSKIGLCTLGGAFVLFGVVSIYVAAYIGALHVNDWWGYPTVGVLSLFGVGGGAFGAVFSFASALNPDKLK